jgi:hypothetical protein
MQLIAQRAPEAHHFDDGGIETLELLSDQELLAA